MADTVKLRYEGLTYSVSSVIAYASSRSHDFSVQNMSVSTYLDIAYPRLLRTNFWAQPTTDLPSTYLRPPSRRVRS